MDFLRKDIDKIRARLESGTISLNETSRLEEKKAEDERNEERKKIEDQINKLSKPIARLVIDAKKGVTLSDKDQKKKKPTLEESADGESEGVTDAVDLTESIELKEALHIMSDWLNIQSALKSSTIAKDKDSAKGAVIK
jgi:hypothetical protein